MSVVLSAEGFIKAAKSYLGLVYLGVALIFLNKDFNMAAVHFFHFKMPRNKQ